MSSSRLIRAGAGALALALAAARGSIVTGLPGAPIVPWRQIAGYVNYTSPMQKSTHFTFHWIMESQGNPARDPLVVWTNGGPGCSGLFGAGFENGPWRAQADGTLALNPLAWNKFATTVFIEQPAGVGFSYSSVPADYQNYNDSVSSTDNAAFLSAFFADYPEYANLPLYLTSESYGGNYVPQATRVILEGTDNRLKQQLKGFAVGNPVVSITQDTANFAQIMNLVTAGILHGHALIPTSFYATFVEAGCAAFQPPAVPCNEYNNILLDLAGQCYGGNACGDDMYANPFGNATLGVATVPTVDADADWTAYLNRPDVQAAIHVHTPVRAPWADCANIGYDVTWPSNIPDYTAAFAAGLRVLIFSGDVDVTTCPFESTQVFVEALTALAGGEITANWTSWAVQGLGGLAAGQTGGYIERHRAFTFATVKAAGHEAPGYQPLASFQLIKAFVTNSLDALAAPPAPPRARALPGRATQSSILRAAVAKTRAAAAAAAQ